MNTRITKTYSLATLRPLAGLQWAGTACVSEHLTSDSAINGSENKMNLN